ncbi:hypothetical protein [Porticoccus sp.]
MTTISVPVDTDKFIKLVDFLRSKGSDRDPVATISLAIDYWMDNADWKAEELLPEVFEIEKGYMWKEVFLPHGTSLRMRYKNQYHYAVVKADSFLYDGVDMSPAQFANTVTKSSRNAWRDLEVKRPQDRDWVPADKLRGESQKKQIDLDALFNN